MKKGHALLCVAIVLLLVPTLLSASDTLLIHGHIYTGNAKAPWAQALAITGTRIDAVGSDQEILARRQPKTQVNAYTKGSALARFSEDRLGTLEPGKEADLLLRRNGSGFHGDGERLLQGSQRHHSLISSSSE